MIAMTRRIMVSWGSIGVVCFQDVGLGSLRFGMHGWRFPVGLALSPMRVGKGMKERDAIVREREG